jgi:hypothetical protein
MAAEIARTGWSIRPILSQEIGMRGRGCEFAFLCLPALVLIVGCGPDNPLGRKALHGVVKLDGAPLDKGRIEFHPIKEGGVQSGGQIANGRYSIPAHEGATLGEYRVVIYDTPDAPPLPPGHMPGDDLPPQPKQKVPAEWHSKSQKKIEVKREGPFGFDFEIETKKKA